MKNIDLFFESPALLLLAVPAAAFVLAAPRLLRRERGGRAAAALRCLEVLLLAALAAGPCVTLYSHEAGTVLLVDRSGSVAPAREQTDAQLAAAAPSATLLEFAAAPAPAQPDPDGTDLAAAIRAACAALGESGGRRIVLLSDGVPTAGDALAAAQEAAQAGLRLDAVPVRASFPSPQTELSAFDLPAEAAEGQAVTAAVTVLSDAAAEGVLRIYDGDALAHEQAVTLEPGKQVFSCALTAGNVGTHTLCARLTARGDTLPHNDALTRTMDVRRGESILLVDGTGAEAERLAALLRESGMEPAVARAQDVPQTVAGLCRYGLTVLMNVNANDLPEGWDETLSQAVSAHGRSVLTTGGENTYLYGGMKDSPYERLLPVAMSVEERESVDPMALLLVMDTTDSMTRASAGVPIDMAKRGAIKCVDALGSNDYAGVITFSDEAVLAVPMTAMRDKQPVLEAINGIQTVGPERLTKFSGALRLACDTLKAFDGVQRKHVMFITDGSPADDKQAFARIAREMRGSGITLSTIAVGRIVNVVQMLEELALTGGGRCYPVESGRDLADIMSVDSVLSQVEYTVEGPFKPQPADACEQELTQLYGYVRVNAKPDAQVLLSTPEGRPLYARHGVGSGAAASFMSDLSGNWSRAWFAGEQGRETILRLIRGLLPQTLSGGGTDAAPQRTREYDLLSAPDGGVMLAQLCACTGGTVFDTLEEALAFELPPAARPLDPVPPLAALALLCLLADLALRALGPRRGRPKGA